MRLSSRPKQYRLYFAWDNGPKVRRDNGPILRTIEVVCNYCVMWLIWICLFTVFPACLFSGWVVGGGASVGTPVGFNGSSGVEEDSSSSDSARRRTWDLGGLVATFGLGTLLVHMADPQWLDGLLPGSLMSHWSGLAEKTTDVWWLIGGGTILAILGLVDDVRGLPWGWRLSIELLVAAAIVYGQGLRLTAFIGWPWLTSGLSVLWIVGLINSFNMLDNMDGLSGGVAAIIASMLAIMLLLNPDPTTAQPQLFVAAMMLVLLGSLLGFLRFNWPPASIFMGDAGSYLVGYWIAIATLLTTYTGYRSDRPHAIFAPLCLLAIPLYDMASVIWIRLREGRSPFEGDKRHFSHRLVDFGFTKKQAVLTIYLATLTSCLAAVVLPRTDWIGAVVVLAMVGAIVALIAILESRTRSGHES